MLLRSSMLLRALVSSFTAEVLVSLVGCEFSSIFLQPADQFGSGAHDEVFGFEEHDAFWGSGANDEIFGSGSLFIAEVLVSWVGCEFSSILLQAADQFGSGVHEEQFGSGAHDDVFGFEVHDEVFGCEARDECFSGLDILLEGADFCIKWAL
jgi:hypothetical protein